ncbi:MAG: shikimate dehydrogenase [Pseudomonadota bacterium]
MVGHPINHSKSPMIHREFGQQFGLDLHYGMIDATESDFFSTVREFFKQGGEGLNVTVPHKARAAEISDTQSDLVSSIGVANTLGLNSSGHIWADNTDGLGLVVDLTRNYAVEIQDKNILILGAGGAARGILLSLLQEEPKQLAVFNRTYQRARQLVLDLTDGSRAIVAGEQDLLDVSWDLIINTTAAGLNNQRPNLHESVINHETVVYDLQYGDAAKPLCVWAHELGAAKTLNGWGMLVEQAARSFELWHGLKPDTSAMLGMANG